MKFIYFWTILLQFHVSFMLCFVFGRASSAKKVKKEPATKAKAKTPARGAAARSPASAKVRLCFI